METALLGEPIKFQFFFFFWVTDQSKMAWLLQENKTKLERQGRVDRPVTEHLVYKKATNLGAFLGCLWTSNPSPPLPFVFFHVSVPPSI
jgi:hypothetical protein